MVFTEHQQTFQIFDVQGLPDVCVNRENDGILPHSPGTKRRRLEVLDRLEKKKIIG
ncbi:MAG: hypothetical protein KAT62_04465 [Desulfuromonadales bacterium]|nr:hypothetical protein [Chloroflexota bacterium]MCK4621451.1 hypothetical protein [Desulfuromonadales bacterium]